MHHVSGTPISTVGSSHSQAGLLATQHVLELGHRRIGIITGPAERMVTQSRLRGYKHALQSMNIAYTDELVEEADWQVEGGYAATHRLLERAPDITALCVQNDTMAVGVLSALHDRGLCIPQNCAVVSCDDIPLAVHTIPPLTTIHIPFYETGETAVRLLLDLIANPTDEVQRILLPVYLVKRQSSGVHENPHP
jgi:LacI family transcriptional regulator